MVWLGIDIGQKRSGVARSASGVISEPVMLLVGTLAQQIEQLGRYLVREPVNQIVLGRPRAGGAELVDRFAQLLREDLGPSYPAGGIVWVDETLTSKEAERQAAATGSSVDTDILAAQLILEQYFAENSQ